LAEASAPLIESVIADAYVTRLRGSTHAQA
jgi:hypothetical protein